jgi:hypothetical protein
MYTLAGVSQQTSSIVRACVAALVMLGLGLEGLDTDYDDSM